MAQRQGRLTVVLGEVFFNCVLCQVEVIREAFFINMLDKKAADIITTTNTKIHTAAASCAINSPEQNWFSFKEISVQAY